MGVFERPVRAETAGEPAAERAGRRTGRHDPAGTAASRAGTGDGPAGVGAAWIWPLAVYGGATVVVVLALTIVIVAMGANPAEALASALQDSLLTVGGFGQTLNRMTPLLLASLSFAVGYRAGLFNIGMDGQIYAGAILATGLGLLFAGAAGGGGAALQPLLLVAGLAGGALYAVLPAVLRVLWGVNEIFTTVMFNFVALYLVEYLSTGPWNDPTAGEAITRPIPAGALLPMLIPRGGAHVGVLLAVAVALGIWWLLYRTVFGYELRSVGSNPRAALYAGIALGRIQVLALCLGGALSGLAGAIEVTGVHQRLLLGLSPNYGVMAILVAVLGRNHPLLLVPVNLAFAVLVAASDSLQRTVGLPASAVFMVQGLAVLVVLFLEAVRQRQARFTT
ncbi:MAG: ABC transporter permease [Bacillota bacterium]|nr:MAG: ABC transporter permease [Bacillota bacterium]